MKFGLSVATFETSFGPIVYSTSDMNQLDEIFRKMRRIGYDCVDLFIDQTTEEKAYEIKKLLDNNDLKVSMLVCIYLANLGVNFGSTDSEVRSKSVNTYLDQMKIAKILGAPTMPIGFIRGRITDQDNINDYYLRLSESLKDLIEGAKKYSIELCLEPINRYEANTILSLDEAIDFIDKYEINGLKILADFFHMNIEDVNLSEGLRRAGDKIRHVHIPDSNRKAPGMGHLNYHELLGTLKSIAYKGNLVIEAIPYGQPDLCAVSGLEFLKKVIEEIQ
jgi:5-keto-L-gluconate epimerase